MSRILRETIALATATAFLLTALMPAGAYAQMDSVANMPWMPLPGVRVSLSPEYSPSHLVGMTVHPDNALQFDFLIDKGDQELSRDQKHSEYQKLIKYFLASLTVPDDEQWVNLSPYEKDRIISDEFGKTEMGRDLLAQDYILKQITASLMYPEANLGKKFWDRIYARAEVEYGTTNIPVNTFNKVWIVPDEAIVYESGNTAYILKSHLKVMMEEDYLSLRKHTAISPSNRAHTLAAKVVKEIILPELDTEVNEGKNFAPLRQIYSGMILATWYKKELRESLLGKVYADKDKVMGVDQNPKTNEIIYQRYLRAFKKGVFNYIKEDMDTYSQQMIPRKYFSGGFINQARLVMEDIHASNLAMLPPAKRQEILGAITRKGFFNRVDRASTRLDAPNLFNPAMVGQSKTHPGELREAVAREHDEQMKTGRERIANATKATEAYYIKREEAARQAISAVSQGHNAAMRVGPKTHRIVERIPGSSTAGEYPSGNSASSEQSKKDEQPNQTPAQEFKDAVNRPANTYDRTGKINPSTADSQLNTSAAMRVDQPKKPNPQLERLRKTRTEFQKFYDQSYTAIGRIVFQEHLDSIDQQIRKLEGPSRSKKRTVVLGGLAMMLAVVGFMLQMYAYEKPSPSGSLATLEAQTVNEQVEKIENGPLLLITDQDRADGNYEIIHPYKEMVGGVEVGKAQVDTIHVAEEDRSFGEETGPGTLKRSRTIFFDNTITPWEHDVLYDFIKTITDSMPSDAPGSLGLAHRLLDEIKEKYPGNKNLLFRCGTYVDNLEGISELKTAQIENSTSFAATILSFVLFSYVMIREVVIMAIIKLRNLRNDNSMMAKGDIDLNAAMMAEPPLKGKKILIVDDDLSIRESLRGFLEVIGANKNDIQEAVNGQEALDKLRSGKKIDLIITDYQMPQKNGEQLIREIKNDPALSKIQIIMRADIDSDKRESLANELKIPVISKTDIGELEGAIKELFRVNRAMTAEQEVRFRNLRVDVLRWKNRHYLEGEPLYDEIMGFVRDIGVHTNPLQLRVNIINNPNFDAVQQTLYTIRKIKGLRLATQKRLQNSPPKSQQNAAMRTKGGIDLNAANLDLQIKRDGRGVPLPLAQQDMSQLSRIEGFVPVIIEIKPVTNLPLLSELQQKLQSLPSAT